MKIATLNVEGIATAIENGFGDWLDKAKPDVLALQEIWQLPDDWKDGWPGSYRGMHATWNPSAKNPRASGTALLSAKPPDSVSFECGVKRMDREGRWILARFSGLRILNLYVPYYWSALKKNDRPCQELLDALREAIEKVLEEEGELLVIGDFNIAPPLHRDYTGRIKPDDPDTWPYKKRWMSSLADIGLIDMHERLEQDPETITWLNRKLQKAKAPKRKGTRIDYHFATEGLADKAASYEVDSSTAGYDDERITDHCSVLATYSLLSERNSNSND